MAALKKTLTSLGFTLASLALLGTLVVLCTLGQVEIGTFNAIDKYFRAFWLWTHLPGTDVMVPWFPGGGAVGLLLAANLGAVLLWRLQRTRRKAGLWLVHTGLALFVVGEFVTGMLAVERQMPIDEGASMDYAENSRLDELVVIDVTDPTVDTVYAVAQRAVRDGRVLSHPAWPFTLRVEAFFPNAEVADRPLLPGIPPPLADQGIGPRVVMRPLPPVSQDDRRNLPAAYVQVKEGPEARGTWLLSSAITAPQEFFAGGRRWSLALRAERGYLPFTLTLKDFKHDKYAGTDIPKNFSSLVRLTDPTNGTDRDVLIYMNTPLRYGGHTFYQASFGKADTMSVLQVVRNPGWLLPYLSFILVGLGLLVHFGLMLGEARSVAAPDASAPAAPASGFQAWAPQAAAAAAILYALAGLLPQRQGPVDAARFGRLPTLHNGRVKPLDTIARTSLLVISGKQTVRDGAETLSADRWLLELASDPSAAARRPLFLIHDPDLLGLLGRRQEKRTRFSWEELTPGFAEISRQADRAEAVETQLRTRFESAVHSLNNRLMLFHRLRNTLGSEDAGNHFRESAEYALAVADGINDFTSGKAGKKPTKALERLGAFFSRYQELERTAYFKPVPPAPGEPADSWRSVPADLLRALKDGRVGPEASAWAGFLDAAKAGDSEASGRAMGALELSARTRAPGALERARSEALFNAAEPFFRGLVLYLAVFLCAMASFLSPNPVWRRAALALLAASFAVHTVGLLARMVLQGRPPVTNLYSSAVFVGWVAVFGALWLERSSRRGLAAAVGGAAGFSTLLIAHHLAASGDTLEMMQAVLDSNFWLGTHVVTITIGYAGTFLAGLFAHLWIFKAWLGRLGEEEGRALYRMTYGTVCFALFFSFIGTVLGGIWADQSWGRFWGWDPKENGAFMIVLWSAAMLHARMGGYVREKGFMVLAVLGDIVTALSWFGVNMLGIGLHSYGFMDKAAAWLIGFCVFQLLVAAVPFRSPRRAERPA